MKHIKNDNNLYAIEMYERIRNQCGISTFEKSLNYMSIIICLMLMGIGLLFLIILFKIINNTG